MAISKFFWYFRFFRSKAENLVVYAFTYVSESSALIVLTAMKQGNEALNASLLQFFIATIV
jgi:hypothetical protein